MKLTKTQTLALFLGVATPAAVDVLNGPSANVPEGQSASTASSGTACAGNGDCADDAEVCGSYQLTDVTPENICVQSKYCASLGREGGVAWSLQCWEDAAEGVAASAPAVVDAGALMTGIEDLITKSTTNWDGVENIFVSSRFNHQDGWWIKEADDAEANAGQWVETDKPIDNRCFLDVQCPPQDGVERCCAKYPDTNNRRCIAKSEHAISITVGPVTFAPSCESLETAPDDEGDGGDEPTNAGDDIAAGALAEASEALASYFEQVKADKQDADNYTDMTDEEKATWDEEWEASESKRGENEDDFKEEMRYAEDDCDDACKERFQAELLKFYKARYSTCSDNAKDISCIKADEIFEDKIKAQNGDPDDETSKNWFFDMDQAEREAFDSEWEDKVAREKSGLAAAWVKENAPDAGEEGSPCEGGTPQSEGESAVDSLLGALSTEYGKCSDEAQCCGDATQTGDSTNKLENICINKTTLKYTDILDREYTHVCQAAKLFAAAAAAATLCSSLM